MLPCFKLNRIPKKRHFWLKKVFSYFHSHFMLYSTDFYLILCQICTWTDVQSYLFQLCCLPIFFQLNVTTWFLQDTFFRHFDVFTKKISLCQAVQLAFISTRRECYSPVRQILQLAEKRIKAYFFLFDYHGDHCGNAWRM